MIIATLKSYPKLHRFIYNLEIIFTMPEIFIIYHYIIKPNNSEEKTPRLLLPN